MTQLCELSPGQIMSWYHSKIPRIPHGNQNPKKRYLKENEILELFDGIVHIQEKVDGKLSYAGFFVGELGFNRLDIIEDMTGKNTCHKHIEYTKLPSDKRIRLDSVILRESPEIINFDNNLKCLDYAVIDGSKLDIQQIYRLLECVAGVSSHFGRERIEGLVIKNYEKQLMGKWINDEFEDHLNGGE